MSPGYSKPFSRGPRDHSAFPAPLLYTGSPPGHSRSSGQSPVGVPLVQSNPDFCRMPPGGRQLPKSVTFWSVIQGLLIIPIPFGSSVTASTPVMRWKASSFFSVCQRLCVFVCVKGLFSLQCTDFWHVHLLMRAVVSKLYLKLLSVLTSAAQEVGVLTFLLFFVRKTTFWFQFDGRWWEMYTKLEMISYRLCISPSLLLRSVSFYSNKVS